MSWVLFLARRLAGAALALAVLSLLIFAATEVLPGDAASAVAGPNPTPEQLARARTELGLDRPAVQRYLEWMSGALGGDLGTAYVGGRGVSAVLADRLPNSLLLGGLVYALVVPLSVGLGLLAGFGAVSTRRAARAIDRIVSMGSMGAVGMPEFVLAGLLLAVLGSWLGLVPEVALIPVGGSPLDVPGVLVLPVLSLMVLATASGVRLMRASVADVLTSPHLEAARLAGIRGGLLLTRYVLPNALGPAVQALALGAGAVIGGAVVVESIFNYPGVGNELSSAVATRDLPLVQGLALALCAVSLLVLLVGDVVGRLLTPRLRDRR